MHTSSRRQEKLSNYLQKKYNDLEQDWNSFQKLNPPRQRCSTDDVNILSELHNDSPTNLIPALQQHKGSPLEGEWKVWTNDLAILETLAERKAVRESGKFKGRRLFTSSETASSFGLSEKEIYNSEMSSWCSSSTQEDYDDGQVDNECTCSASKSVQKVENKKVLVIEDVKNKEQGVANGSSSIGLIKKMALLGSFVVVVVLMFFTIFIISFNSLGLDEDRDFMFLT